MRYKSHSYSKTFIGGQKNIIMKHLTGLRCQTFKVVGENQNLKLFIMKILTDSVQISFE